MDTKFRPLVSVVLAVRNEERHIEAVLKSLLQQETYNCELEILIVDGDSLDATREIVNRISGEDARVKLLINKRKKTPYAFNLGIQQSQGLYICILGAHTVYARDYIATCLDELRLHGAGGCSGREITRPSGYGLQAQLIAWTLAHPFGTSTGSMRTRKTGFADTIPYPIFLKSTLLEVGCYNTQLDRNQDNDLSQRLRARGYKLYITDKTCCEYFVSPTVVSLTKYAFKTGFWNIISFKTNPSSMSIRHFVPGLFVFVLLLSLLTFGFSIHTPGYVGFWFRLPFLLLGATYSTASIAAASQVAFRERTVAALLMPIIFISLHVSYGVGTLFALISNAHRRSFELDRGELRSLSNP
jgi:succinoglycan biosynthesis protein ExoA